MQSSMRLESTLCFLSSNNAASHLNEGQVFSGDGSVFYDKEGEVVVAVVRVDVMLGLLHPDTPPQPHVHIGVRHRKAEVELLGHAHRPLVSITSGLQANVDIL